MRPLSRDSLKTDDSITIVSGKHFYRICFFVCELLSAGDVSPALVAATNKLKLKLLSHVAMLKKICHLAGYTPS